ncbi:MAG: Kynurenine formamidase [Phycisphaerae bacterium]|nr:Kynurenine formamidase [Phycisphaerae bacterium]
MARTQACERVDTTGNQQPNAGVPAGPPIIDITPPISAALGVWPGDTPMSREVLLDMRRGDNITLSTLRATVHLGAHADAPSHYGTDAPTIEQRSLEPYVGACRVVRIAAGRGSRVTLAQFDAAIAAAPRGAFRELPPRILIATGTFPDPQNWNRDFAALAPELVDGLQARGVRLIGVDVPSVDLFDSKDLPAHQRFLKHDVAILEGLVLRDVPAGDYELIALPLPLVGFDASPVRAILRPLAEGGSR